jgi:hypothetical protein
MLELGDIPVLSVHLAVVDPDAAPKSLKENNYQLHTPDPEPLESLRKQGRLRGDIIVFNGDGDFTLDTWVQYQENPEDFEDNGEDYQDEDDDEGGEDEEVSSSPHSLSPSLPLSPSVSLTPSLVPAPPPFSLSLVLALSFPPSLPPPSLFLSF